MSIIDQAAERTTTLGELAGLDRLSDQDQIRRGAPVFAKLDKWLNEIFGKPAWMAATAPVTFESMIEKWAKHTNAPKKGRQDMETKCGEFIEWLGHDDMARVTFENGRDYRDEMIDEGELYRAASRTT